MYVCMHVCMYVCLHARMYVCLHARMYVCMLERECNYKHDFLAKEYDVHFIIDYICNSNLIDIIMPLKNNLLVYLAYAVVIFFS